jgi:hypothetical protein
MKQALIAAAAIFMFVTSKAQHRADYYHDKKIQVLELRNYVLREGGRDKFIDSFKVYIEDSQNAKGAYVLGLYRVKSAENNFFWLRGYENMPARKKAMEDFYSSNYWSGIVRIAREFVINFHNVHLLKPYDINTGDSTLGFDAKWFDKPKGVAVIDVYTGNGTRADVIGYVKNTYHNLLISAGVKDISYWIAEDKPNNYPQHPVFQDSNSLVSISFFKNENEYRKVRKKLAEKMGADMRNEMRRIFTLYNNVVLYNAY